MVYYKWKGAFPHHSLSPPSPPKTPNKGVFHFHVNLMKVCGIILVKRRRAFILNKYQEALEFHKQFKEVLMPKGMGSIACINFEARFDKSIKLLQELVNKETPMKMTDKYMRKCPKCGKDIAGGHDLDVECMSYCFECGKHLDWSEDEK